MNTDGAVITQARVLQNRWFLACEQCRVGNGDPGVLDVEEQEAHDALIDFLEDNDLNYSKYDPRGTR